MSGDESIILEKAGRGFRLIKFTAAVLGVTLIAIVGISMLVRGRGMINVINAIRVITPSALLILAVIYSTGLAGVARGAPPGIWARLPAWFALVFSLPQIAGRLASLWFELYMILAPMKVNAGDKDRAVTLICKSGNVCTILSIVLLLWSGRSLCLFLGETVLARKALPAGALVILLGTAIMFGLSWEIPGDRSRFQLQLLFLLCLGSALLIIAGIAARAFEGAIKRELRDFRD